MLQTLKNWPSLKWQARKCRLPVWGKPLLGSAQTTSRHWTCSPQYQQIYRNITVTHNLHFPTSLLFAPASVSETVQNCVQSRPITCPTISQSASSCRWLAQPSPTPFFFDASAARSTIPFVNRRSSFYSRCRGHTLEHTASGCPVIPFTSGLPPASEDIPLPQIISWCCMTGRLHFRRLRWLIAILATLKISWLIEQNITE